ncbi:MAG: hypothetical protein KDC66_16000 [Phaeodactylibacter sp.]|nr:hypothetical protein [Phaeodactylibacter sp.]MCB9274766.1 hypothetical protein [Lewinellaceae bacterium]
MMKIKSHICLPLLFAAVTLAAQTDSSLLDKGFRFQDGVYLSFDELRRNEPALSWNEVDAQLVSNMQAFSAQAAYIRRKGGGALPADSIWGFSLNGLPFVRLPDTVSVAGAMAFAGLRVRGRICYFTYEAEETQMVEIAAYNPLTGKPFRKGVVPREKAVTKEYIMHFENGAVLPFGREAFQAWIEDDPQLWRTVVELPEAEAAEKLYKCLLIYDDRNQAFVPVND